MGTTIAGNQHIGTNYLKNQYIWAPGLGGTVADVELYEEEYIFVYQFNPLHDQRDDGVYAIEFYYYYRKPTTSEFWNYVYDPDYFYIYPFVAGYNDDSRWGPVGKWEGFWTFDSEKISLVGRESGWIHVTLHVEEPIYGRYTYNGKTMDCPLYIGIYSPIPVFCWDNSVSGSDPIIPLDITWDFEEHEDEEIYDVVAGGYLEDCYVSRRQINDYPSFYITYRDVTPESFNYAVTEQAVMNVTSGITKKAIFKKLMAEIKEACGTPNRKLLAKRNAGIEAVSYADSFRHNQIFKRLFSEALNTQSLLRRNNCMNLALSSAAIAADEKANRMLFFRGNQSESISLDSFERRIDYTRLLEPDPNIESSVERKQQLFRNAESQSMFEALPFASRLFFRTVQTVLSFWDWVRGKIREANNVVTLFCPVYLEIELECKI